MNEETEEEKVFKKTGDKKEMTEKWKKLNKNENQEKKRKETNGWRTE